MIELVNEEIPQRQGTQKSDCWMIKYNVDACLGIEGSYVF